jgi:hypothetical protein
MWLNCPGSARENEKMPDQESEYAEEGTLAHHIAELKLKNHFKMISPQKYGAEMKKARESKYYNEEMNSHCESYLNYIEELPEGNVLVEQKLDYSEYVPEGYGTGDTCKVTDETLHVVDLKYGKGVKVEAEDNTQLKFYALGAILALEAFYDFEKVVVHIFQPRLGEPTTAEYTVEEIKEWAESIKEPAQKAWNGVQEFHSGDHCKWCKIKNTCVTRMTEQAQNAFYDVFVEPEDVIGRSAVHMKDEEITYWLSVADGVTKFLADLKKYAEDQAINHGKHYDGFKIVEGRSNRVYSDEIAVRQALVAANIPSEIFLKPAEVLGITALEKAIGKPVFKEVVDPLLIKPPGKPTLVPLSDNRTPIESGASEAFND